MLKIPIVINKARSAFALTDALAAELRRRGCSWIGKFARGDVMELWFAPRAVVDEARRDPLLVEIVRSFEAQCAGVPPDRPWREVTALEQQLLNGLCVVEVSVAIEVEEYNGHETVRVRGGLW